MISSILLTAGESKRMDGENKLVKEINGIPILKYAIKNILGSSIDEIIVVLGHEKEIIESIIEKNKKITFVYNKNYKKGVTSSIQTGLKFISKKAEAFFICLGDMPNVNQNIYNKMIKAKYNYNKKLKPNLKKEIIIPNYNTQEGNPLLFSKYMKKKIMNTKEDFVFEKIIELNREKVLNVPFKNGGVVLDFNTQEDFNF
jgi:molybdenum cofactor cytidylyltransferase